MSDVPARPPLVARAPVETKLILAISGAATALALLIALGGTWAVATPVPAWPRFWATAYFVLLLWPVGLGLLGRLAGWRVQAAVAAVALVATMGQQVGRSRVPL